MTPEQQWSIREREMLEKIEHLEKLVYVPGVKRCAKCGFQLVSTTMCAQTGNFSANNEPQQCANGCGPMWRVTERDAGNRLCDRIDESMPEVMTRPHIEQDFFMSWHERGFKLSDDAIAGASMAFNYIQKKEKGVKIVGEIKVVNEAG